MDTLKDLWNNKNKPQGKVNMVLFFINLFLLMCHIFLMIIYIIVGHKFMICLNIISLFVYGTQFFECFKKPKIYVFLTFIEIWIHMICAIISFGLKPCFQNWSFALLSAYFLPSINDNKDKKSLKQSFIFNIILIATYFLSFIIVNSFNFPLPVVLSDKINTLLFVLNNLFSFISIIMFALFYTSSLKRKEFELTRKADYDELTELYNRYALLQISKRIELEAKKHKREYCVAIIDIDYFKKVNDKYGHNSGDLVLKKLSEILKENSIKGLTPARWGGEEFIIIAPSSVNYVEFKEIMEKLRLKISKSRFRINDKKTINITISIGTVKVKNSEIFNDAVKNADKNLYEAKERGRNRLVG